MAGAGGLIAGISLRNMALHVIHVDALVLRLFLVVLPPRFAKIRCCIATASPYVVFSFTIAAAFIAFLHWTPQVTFAMPVLPSVRKP
jgi:hypothetical protein